MSSNNNFFGSVIKASQKFTNAVVDTGAKTMLKTDIVFLERDIKSRKQLLGIQVYEILSRHDNNANNAAPEIQRAFDECRRDISNLEAKMTTKREEMEAIRGTVPSESVSSATGENSASSTNAEMECGIPPARASS